MHVPSSWENSISLTNTANCFLTTPCRCFLVAKSRLTLCDPTDCSPPSSSVHGILQARILERVAISSSRGSSWPRDWTWVSCISCTGKQILYHFVTREVHMTSSLVKSSSSIKSVFFLAISLLLNLIWRWNRALPGRYLIRNELYWMSPGLRLPLPAAGTSRLPRSSPGLLERAQPEFQAL